MKTIVPFCFLLLIALGESGWRGRYGKTTWPGRQTTWWPRRQTTWWPRRQTTWRPPATTRPARKPTGRQTTRPWKTVPGGQIISATKTPACPDGYPNCREVWNGRCFPHISAYASPFHNARRHCILEGRSYGLAEITGDLASFHSQEQLDALMDFAGSELIWIGLTKNNRNHWEFTDGSPFDFVPANLAFVSYLTEDTAAVSPSDNYVSDVPSSSSQRYVCLLCFWEQQWPVKQFPHVTDNRNDRTCKHGVCYKLQVTPKTFDEGEHICKGLGGHLASFHSREQFEFLWEISGDSSDHVWIGAHNRNGHRWMFTDDTPMDYLPSETKFDVIPERACVLLDRGVVLADHTCGTREKYACVLPYIPD